MKLMEWLIARNYFITTKGQCDRAIALRKHLEKSGYPKGRFEIDGLGETAPCRPLQRRQPDSGGDLAGQPPRGVETQIVGSGHAIETSPCDCIYRSSAVHGPVSYTHLTLPTNREV